MDIETRIKHTLAVSPMAVFYLTAISAGELTEEAKALYESASNLLDYSALKALSQTVDVDSPEFFNTLQSSINSPVEYFEAFSASLSAIMSLEEAFGIKRLLIQFAETIASGLSNNPDGSINDEYETMLAAMVNLMGLEADMDKLDQEAVKS